MAIVIRRLEEHDELENFDCGDDALNNYLKRHAWTNQQKSSIGVSYMALDEDAPRTVLGYFTLAMASVPRDSFPKKYVRGLPPYHLPLILLARLAVDQRFAGRGLGYALISEALRISLRVADEVGCRCIVTDAYRDRVSWYVGIPPNANTSCTIEVPASLRSEICSPSARNAVRVPPGISVRLRRNPQLRQT